MNTSRGAQAFARRSHPVKTRAWQDPSFYKASVTPSLSNRASFPIFSTQALLLLGRMKTFYNVYAICGFAAIGGGLFGFDISSMSGVLGTPAYGNYFGHPAGTRQGGIVSLSIFTPRMFANKYLTASMPAGSLVGALCSSFLADRLSRKTAIQIAAVIWCVGAILQAASNGVPLLCVGRVVGGFAIGICSAIVPVYQSEIAPKEIRGRVVSLQQWAITWGILIQYFVQYGSSFYDGGVDNEFQGTAAFRIPWGIQAVPGAILFLGLFFFPKSPRWLASKDRWEEALTVLANLHGSGDKNHPKVLAEYHEIEEALRFEREVAETSFAALIKPRILKRVILGMSIQMWSQLCGMNIMVSLSATLLCCRNSEYNSEIMDLDLAGGFFLQHESNSSEERMANDMTDVLHCVHHAWRWYR